MMIIQNISPATQHILRFYAKCFVYPYEEMQYELQHLFRLIERDSESTEELAFVEQILNILNMYQGMELKELREDYVNLFTENAPCPLIASEFIGRYSIKYDSEVFGELITESGIPVNPDEPVDSVINYIEYMSLLSEDFLLGGGDQKSVNSFLKEHISVWIPAFCEVLYKSSNLGFYREIAVGINEYISWLINE
jgi:TorA maturation chaperone TorD